MSKKPCSELFCLHKQRITYKKEPTISTLSLSTPPSVSLTSQTAMNPLIILLFSTSLLSQASSSYADTRACRTYCGNITVDYPFATKYGCGHSGFRDLLYCINDVLMLHISSGSYRVLEIDYAYQSLTLHDPHLSTCSSIVLGHKGNGFVVDPFMAPYLSPDPDNVFLLIGCTAESPLFQGFPTKHLPCRNVSGMGCEDYYRCPAWGFISPKEVGQLYRAGPPECCAVSFQAIRSINLTRLDCQGYSSAYSVAPLRLDGPHSWSYGIRVKYSVQGNDAFCRACEATGGTCGFGGAAREMCLCGTWNSTTTCDDVKSSSNSLIAVLRGHMISLVAMWAVFLLG